ncbi:unnamed protein product [Urochloa humidicola]
MALDLNIPATEDEDDPFGGLPHAQDPPPLAGAHPMGDADGAQDPPPLAGAHPMGDADGAQDPPPLAGALPMGDADGAPSFDLNIAIPESDEDADVYAHDFHVSFADEADVNGSDEGASFDLNCDLEEDGLDGSSDEEHVEQG